MKNIYLLAAFTYVLLTGAAQAQLLQLTAYGTINYTDGTAAQAYLGDSYVETFDIDLSNQTYATGNGIYGADVFSSQAGSASFGGQTILENGQALAYIISGYSNGSGPLQYGYDLTSYQLPVDSYTGYSSILLEGATSSAVAPTGQLSDINAFPLADFSSVSASTGWQPVPGGETNYVFANISSYTVTVSPTPEPKSSMLALLALAGIVCLRRLRHCSEATGR